MRSTMNIHGPITSNDDAFGGSCALRN